jgi:hypothetical protein
MPALHSTGQQSEWATGRENVGIERRQGLKLRFVRSALGTTLGLAESILAPKLIPEQKLAGEMEMAKRRGRAEESLDERRLADEQSIAQRQQRDYGDRDR